MRKRDMREKKSKKYSIYQMTTCALMAALMCVLGPMSIQIGIIPISFTNLVIYLAVILLGAREATISCCVYLLLGLVGLPVFSGYTGGLAKLAGPTGGYLVGFIFMAIISGIFYDRSKGNVIFTVAGMVLGTAVTYLFGTVWYVVETQCAFTYAISVCVLPFLGVDAVKIAAAVALGKAVRGGLEKAHLVQPIGQKQ
jgi:biotin transport system substrate-specific component